MATCMQPQPRERVTRNESTTSIQVDILEALQNTNKEAFKFINEGLDQEDKGNFQNAIVCYEKGLRIIESGIRLNENKELGLTPESALKYKNLLSKISRAQKEIMIRLETLKAENQLSAVTPSAPPAPPMYEESCTDNRESSHVNLKAVGDQVWQDVKELLSINEGIRLFHVDDKGNVSTWASAERTALQVFQLLKNNLAEKVPPAFMKCGEWVYPLEPGQSPVLKTQHRTYMFPDINMTSQESNTLNLSSIGIVIADIVPDTLVKRFERILSCYGNFRNEISTETTTNVAKSKPKRPPPPAIKSGSSSSSKQEEGVSSNTLTTTVTDDVIHVEPASVSERSVQEYQPWTEKITAGISIGSQWISWGLLKGAEYTSVLVEKGAQSLRERLKPDEETKTVDPEISHNIRQLQQATGSVVQVSAFLVTALGALTVSLGKKLAPHVSEQGQKLLPAKYNTDNNPDTQKKIDDVKKVAVAGLQGMGLMFLSLEQAGKNLYQSVSTATVKTMQHKYGEEVAEVTQDAMAAAGNAVKTVWNVKQLGPKAIAKRAIKDTGKAMVMDGEEIDQQIELPERPRISQ